MSIVPQSELEENSFFQRNEFFILTVFVIVILVVILAWPIYRKPGLQLLKDDLSQKVTALEGSPEFKKLNEYLDLRKQKAEIQKLNQGKFPILTVLKLIEEATLPSTVFNQFNINSEARSVDLSGIVSSYATIALQIDNFEKDGIVKNVTARNPIRNENNTINFNLVFTVK